MRNVGKSERETQDRIISLFHDELGYDYLGNWIDREGNSNIEEVLLHAYLTRCGYTQKQINVALYLAENRSEQTQPQPLQQQPGFLQLAALWRPCENRGWKGH